MYRLRPVLPVEFHFPETHSMYKMKAVAELFDGMNKYEISGGEAKTALQNGEIEDRLGNKNSTGSLDDQEALRELENRWHGIESKLLSIKSEVGLIKGDAKSTSLEASFMEDTFVSEDLLAFHEEILRRVIQLQATLQTLQRTYAVVGSDQKTTNPVEDIIMRQQASLLSLIASLNKDILSLCSAPEKVYDLVIYASPSHPPHSLKIMKRLLDASGVKVYARTHSHSTVKVDPALENFVVSPSSLDRSACHVIITLVWKNVEGGPLLHVSPTAKVPISGEHNVARLLSRLLPDHLSYEKLSVQEATKVDHFLDFAHDILLRGSKKDLSANLQMLDQILRSNRYLTGISVTIADMVLWSVVSQVAEVSSFPANLKAWFQNMASL